MADQQGRGPGRTRVRSADEGPPGIGIGATGAAGSLFLRQAALDPQLVKQGYPFTLPVARALSEAGGLELDTPVTFLVGHNGSGKSTLVEALAVALGFNAEGGSASFQFSTAATHSTLAQALVLRRGTTKPRGGYFLRAESFYNVASEIDRLDAQPAPPSARKIIDAYGGTSLHERSHGESFLDLLTHRFGPRGLYLLDEPEAALSPRGEMTALARIHRLAAGGAQFVIATHSPILLAVPDAAILEIDDGGQLRRVDYEAAMPVALTREFLTDRHRWLAQLLDDDESS